MNEHVLAIEKQFRQMEQKSESSWDTNLNYPSAEVDRSDCNLRFVWSLVDEKSNFESQNPDLDWSKGTQHMTGFTVRDFFFLFSGFISMGILLWLVLFGLAFAFKHLKRFLPKEAWEWCVEKAESVM